MGDWFYYGVAAFLVVAWTFPRRHLHVAGLVGMAIMCYRAAVFGPDWPMCALNGACSVVHAIMCWRLWILMRPPT